MSSSGAISGNSSMDPSWGVAVAKQQQDQIREDGKAAVQLIEAASAPQNTPAHVGRSLNVTA
jgi:hypothetical protein